MSTIQYMQDHIAKMENAVRIQAEWIAGLKYEDLPEEVIKAARRQITDGLGCMVAGNTTTNLDFLPTVEGDCPIFGTDKKATRQWAVLINGGAMCKMEYDEGNWYGFAHTALHLIPALLVQGEYMSRNGGLKMKDLIVALVAAYEISTRWTGSCHINPAMHMHACSGSCASAVAVGKLIGLNPEELAQIIFLTNTLPQCTTNESSMVGDQIRNLYVGLCNFAGLNAIDFYRMGFFSSASSLVSVWEKILDNKDESVVQKVDYEYMTYNLGSEYLILKNYYKKYSGCRFLHAPADMLVEADLSKEEIAAIKQITFYTSEFSATMNRVDRRNAFASRFSTPVGMAVLLLRGGMNWLTMTDENIAAQDVRELSYKIKVVGVPEYHVVPEECRYERMVLEFEDGEVREYVHRGCHGDWDQPFSDEILDDKFRLLTCKSWGKEKANEILEIVGTMPPDGDTAVFFSMLGK